MTIYLQQVQAHSDVRRTRMCRPGTPAGRNRTREPLGYEPAGRRLQSPRGSQTRRSRLTARPSRRAASHPSRHAPRFVHKSVHNKASSKCSRLGETSVPALLLAYTVALRREGRYREADELLARQASVEPPQMCATRDHWPRGERPVSYRR